MSQPVQFSLEPSATAVSALLYETTAALSQPLLTTEVPAVPAISAPVTQAPAILATPVQDTVTLSAEAVKSSSSSSKLLAFTTTAATSLLAQQNAQAVFESEYPLQYLLDVGYSPSEIAVLFGLPTEVGSTVAAVHTFDSAA